MNPNTTYLFVPLYSKFLEEPFIQIGNGNSCCKDDFEIRADVKSADQHNLIHLMK